MILNARLANSFLFDFTAGLISLATRKLYHNAYAWLRLWSDFRTLTITYYHETQVRVKALPAKNLLSKCTNTK